MIQVLLPAVIATSGVTILAVAVIAGFVWIACGGGDKPDGNQIE